MGRVDQLDLSNNRRTLRRDRNANKKWLRIIFNKKEDDTHLSAAQYIFTAFNSLVVQLPVNWSCQPNMPLHNIITNSKRLCNYSNVNWKSVVCYLNSSSRCCVVLMCIICLYREITRLLLSIAQTRESIIIVLAKYNTYLTQEKICCVNFAIPLEMCYHFL